MTDQNWDPDVRERATGAACKL